MTEQDTAPPSDLQEELSCRRLSELSDSEAVDYSIQQFELLSTSAVDLKVDDTDMISDCSKGNNGARLNLQERIDGEISEVNQNVYLDANLSPLSLGDASSAAPDLNDTTILLQRAHEANCLLSKKDGDGSLKDAEWHSLQSSIMQVISRPEPLGHARSDSGNVAANKTVTFANDVSLDCSDVSVADKDFTPLLRQHTSLVDDSNLLVQDANLCDQSQLKDNDNSGCKIPSFPPGNIKISNEIKSNNPPRYSSAMPAIPSLNAAKDDSNGKYAIQGIQDNSALSKDCQDLSLDIQPLANPGQNSLLKKDRNVKPDFLTDSQSSDVLFVPSFYESQSMPDSLFLQSLSETSVSLKSDIQKLLSNEIPKPFKLHENPCGTSSNVGMVESRNISCDDKVKKKLAFSANKEAMHDISKEFMTSKPNLTSSVKGSSLPSYSFSSSLQSTLGSGSFCIRKIIDEKIEISRNVVDNDDIQSTDSTLTSSLSFNGIGVMPQFNLTSLSSVEEKASNCNSEEGTIPSCPSSFSNPSFQSMPAKPESPVSKLLGSTFKKTEDFLKKLEKLELPYIDKDKVANKEQCQNFSLVHEENSKVDNNIEKKFSPLTKYDNNDGEVLELSDQEILFEQDIKSASLIDPYVSDTTILSHGKDATSSSLLLPLNSLSKVADVHVSSGEELTLTELECDKIADSSISHKTELSQRTANENLETITEAISPDKGKGENHNLPRNASDSIDTSQDDTLTHLQTNTGGKGKGSGKQMFSDTASSCDSDHLNRKIRQFAKLQKQRNQKLTHQRKKTKDFYQAPDIGFYDRRKLHRNKADIENNVGDSRKIYSAPCDFSVLKPMQNNFFENSSSDEYMNLRQGNTAQQHISRGNLYQESHANSEQTNKTSGSELLENSLSKLLHEYEQPVSGKFSESPLIKKLELLSKILREAKLKRNNSHTSDSSGRSPSNISHGRNRIADRRRKSESSCQNTQVDPPTSNNSKPSTIGLVKSTKANSRITGVAAVLDETVMSVCQNCFRRDASTNCPTPCMSSDESSSRSKPLTLQTWTQTNEQTSNLEEYLSSRKSVPRKRWSDKENSEEIVLDVEPPKNEPKHIRGKRERKNTFVLPEPLQDSTLDSNSVDGKGKCSTAWFLSFASDDSESKPLSSIPDLNIAYLENKKADQDDSLCQMPNSNTQIDLREAFQLHKKEFIKESIERVQGVKDAHLRQKHPPKMVKKVPLKSVNGAIIPEDCKSKKIVRIRKPKKAIVKNTWVPKMFKYNELNEEKLRQLRNNRQKMKSYDLKIREKFLKRTRTPNLRKNIYMIERH